MVTVAHIVEKILEKQYFLQEALKKGIINVASLAEEIQEEIEKELNKKVKFSAINMAIRRYSEKLQNHPLHKIKFDETTYITVQSNIIEITLHRNNYTQSYVKQIYELANLETGDFLTITQGIHEIMICANQKFEKDILKIVNENDVKIVIKNLNSLIINLPIESINTIGLFYVSTRALNWKNINIIDIVSTTTEIIFIIEEQHASLGFELLKKLIKN